MGSEPRARAETIHPDDRERMRDLTREARKQGIPTCTEFRFVARDGHIVWVLDQTIPMRNEEDDIVCHQGFLLDITEQRAARGAAAPGAEDGGDRPAGRRRSRTTSTTC